VQWAAPIAPYQVQRTAEQISGVSGSGDFPYQLLPNLPASSAVFDAFPVIDFGKLNRNTISRGKDVGDKCSATLSRDAPRRIGHQPSFIDTFPLRPALVRGQTVGFRGSAAAAKPSRRRQGVAKLIARFWAILTDRTVQWNWRNIALWAAVVIVVLLAIAWAAGLFEGRQAPASQPAPTPPATQQQSTPPAPSQ
jgi:hypothetical protein